MCDRIMYRDHFGRGSREAYMIRTRDKEGGKYIDLVWHCSFLSYKQKEAKVMVVKLCDGYTDVYRLNYNLFGL